MPSDSATQPQDFSHLVREQWTAVFRYLVHATGRVEDAEDLTQETFLRGFKHNLSAKPNPRAWLLAVARNAWRDALAKRRKVKFEALPTQPASKAGINATDLADEAMRVRCALADLTELARSVFLMRVEGELSFSEIAAAHGSTEEACRWHMHQARIKLLKRLTDEE